MRTNTRFVLEEVTPYRMQIVDQLHQEDLERGIIRDNRNKIHHFRCAQCWRFARAIDLHLGETQAVVPCPLCGGHAPSFARGIPRVPVPPDFPRHIEFYRPLTPKEVDDWVEGTIHGASGAVILMGAGPDHENSEAYLEIVDTAATRLINGLLVPRPVPSPY